MKNLIIIAAIASLLKIGLIQQEEPELVDTHLTYTQDILPIIQNRCAMCHNSGTPERNWLDYKTAYRKRDSIKLRLQNRTMPIGVSMLESERQLMIEWVKQGANK